MAGPFTLREKKLGVICAAVVLGCAAYRFIAAPYIHAEKRLSEKIRQARGKISQSRAVIDKAREWERLYHVYWMNFTREEENDEVFAEMILHVRQAAGGLETRVIDIKPASVKMIGETGHIRLFPLEVVAEGPFEGMVHFLYILQGPPYFFRVDEMDLERMSARDAAEGKARIVFSKILFPVGGE